MKKFLLFILFCFSFINVFSQLDREHWFAPMYDGQSNGGPEQYLYLSTNETTPFTVRVYNNNVQVYQKTISKGSPEMIPISRNYIITSNTSDLHKVRTMGLYVKADKPCFANLRFGVTNHAEIVTSKGTAGIGTKFYAVTVPNSYVDFSEVMGFGASFLATEDNTTVTVNNFKKPLTFNGYGSATSFTFTLNKGQSYIIDGRATSTNNRDGFIGASVTADKPISMSNGSFNGQFSTVAGSSDGTDIFMDQSVPVDKLGDEFVIVKGYGLIGNRMEGAVVVATEPGTQIFLNDSVTPITTLANPGDYYSIPETNYVNRGNNHYNIHIRSSKNIYVYQMMGGVESSGGSPLATGGMNYIPPLNCYLPRKIDEIGQINRIGSTSYNTKLNIITEKGAVVKVNGIVPNAQYGPYNISNITADQKWVTYSIPNVSGNITVTSDKAVTAGLSGGSGAAGYGGYFAGFSSTPLITKVEGECLPGVKLSVTEGFDSYLWLIVDPSGNYIPAPGINDTNIYEPQEAGIYAVKIKAGSCPEIQTQDFKFYNCTTYTNYDFDTCSTQVITPVFALSPQTLNPASVKIEVPPTKGTTSIAANGNITYTANLNATGSDTFKFSFCGIGAIPDCETIQATVNLNQIEHYDVALTECETGGTATYNLTLAAVTPDTSVTKTYFKDAAFTQQIPTADLTNYTSPTGFVYVKMKNAFGCEATAVIDLKTKPSPVINPSLYTKIHCDEDIDGVLDGIYKVSVNTITPIVLQNPTYYTVRYYDTEAKANAGGTNNITGTYSFASGASIWIRVDSPDTCPFMVKEIPLNIGTKVPLTSSNVSQEVCDVAADGSETINLANYTAMFTTISGATATYFNTLADAQNNTAAIPASQVISADKTFYYRITASGYCDEIGTLNISFTNGTPSTTLQSNYIFCDGDDVTLDAGPGFTKYVWSTGETSQSIKVSNEGDYWVDLTNTLGCVYHQTVKVTKIPKPLLDTSAYNGINCDNDFDGSVNIKFSTQVTPVILQNAASYTITYYGNAAMTQVLPNDWSYNAPTTVYVSVTSDYCSPVNGTINFGFGNRVPLISSVVTSTVCDDDIDGTETVKLNNYLGMFTTTSGASAKYFTTLAEAQSNTGAIPASQNISGDTTFFYRIKAAGYCDEIGTLNLEFHTSTPSPTLLPEYIVCETGTTTLDAGSGYTNYLWSTGDKTQIVNNIVPGAYWVDLTNSFGCVYRQTVKVTGYPVAKPKFSAYNSILCDEDFDGKISVKFSTDVTPIILPNASLYTIMYYGNPEMTQALPDDWYYTASTTVYVEILSPYCLPVTGSLHFDFGNRIPLLSYDEAVEVCDDDLDGIKSVNLADYKKLFTNDNSVQVAYFDSLSNAEQNIGSLSNPLDISGTKQYYLRFSKAGFCSEIAKLKVTVKIPRTSDVLEDKDICPGSTTELDAGAGFDQYLWSTGETSQSITVGVGDYWVDLTFDGCTYRQYASVKEVEVPIINSIEVTGTTATINVSGGNPPYQYSLNGIDFQDSNIFQNVPYGQNTAYVTSAEGCLVMADFTVIRLLNVITPNGDGYNDYLDYSDLQYKESVLLKIFDRNGLLIFTGEKSNNYRWDGKIQGRPVNTGSYWYVLQWRDPNTETLRQSTGWVMVKNRD